MLNLKTLTVLALLFAPISLVAQQPGDTVTVHVSASHWVFGMGINNTVVTVERLNAVINGKKLELMANLSGPDMLIPGDYRAQLLSEHQESQYEMRQSYKILLPKNRSRTFYVTGIEE
jgi:hypothetical protein